MRCKWVPLFWEPVEGTGERLLAGALLEFGEQHVWRRLIRDDVLENLFGSAAGDPKRLIEHALEVALQISASGDWSAIPLPLLGLFRGEVRNTDATSLSDALRQIVLLHSGFAHFDSLDDEDSESATPEEVNKRFATEVRELVASSRPDLLRYFNRQEKLSNAGTKVRFGFLSDTTALQFSVLHPVRQPASVNFARAKLWELSRVKDYGGLPKAALITAFPALDDPTLGTKQREQLRINRLEIEREADDASMHFFPVHSVAAARDKLLEFA